MAVKRAPHLANLLALAFLVTACSQTSYVDKNVGRQDAGALNPFDREVEYQFDLGLLTDRPSCIAVGSVEPSARRWERLEAALLGRPLDAAAAARTAAELADEFSGRDGVDAPGWYRVSVLPSLVRRAVSAALSS